MSEEIKLLPCPFCGGTDIRIGYDGVYERYYTVCSDCMARGPEKIGWEERAAQAWNAIPRALTWTHEPPKIPGKYWNRDARHSDKVSIVTVSASRIEQIHELKFFYYPGEQWAGPIIEPREINHD